MCGNATVESPSRTWEPDYFTIDATGKVIVSADPSSRSIAISCDSTSPNTVYLVPVLDGRDVSKGRAYPLAPGEGITLTTAAPIAARCLTGQTAIVKIAVERGVSAGS